MDLYSVKDASELTGISRPSLRVYTQRYARARAGGDKENDVVGAGIDQFAAQSAEGRFDDEVEGDGRVG